MPLRSFTSNSRRSLLLAAVLVALVQAALFASELNSPTFFGLDVLSQKYSDAERYRRAGPVDLVVVGNSYALNGLDPAVIERETGLRSFNMAMGATELDVQAEVLAGYVLPRLRPRLVLWHLGPEDLKNNLIASNVGIRASHGFALQRLPFGYRLLPWAQRLLPYQKRQVHQWLVDLRQPRLLDYAPNGFMGRDSPAGADALRYATALPAVLKGPGGMQRLERSDGDMQRARLAVERALQATQERDVRVLGIVTPIKRWCFLRSEPYSKLLARGQFDDFAAWLTPLLERYGVEHVNYAYWAPISDDDSCFYNRKHLSTIGASRFSALVARQMLLGSEPIPAELRGVISPAQLAALDAGRAESAPSSEGGQEEEFE
jgi:hypothetical protein